LSREGEVALAKRIEAGREMMLGAIRESPLTLDAILGWRDALDQGKMLLRDIIDLDATYGSFDRAVLGTPGEAMATPPAGGKPASSMRALPTTSRARASMAPQRPRTTRVRSRSRRGRQR
jgi:RNA polymerase primary sigma factor